MQYQGYFSKIALGMRLIFQYLYPVFTDNFITLFLSFSAVAYLRFSVFFLSFLQCFLPVPFCHFVVLFYEFILHILLKFLVKFVFNFLEISMVPPTSISEPKKVNIFSFKRYCFLLVFRNYTD